MSYRRALVLRWRRNDRLAVAVLAVTVAFLVGTVLFVFAAGSQTAALAANLESPGAATHYGTPADARAAAQPDDVVVPLATATGPDGESTVAGVPNGTDREFGDRRLRAGTTRGTLAAPATQDLRGETTVTVSVTPRERSVLPPSWYVVRPATVERLGPTGALVIEGGSGADEADGTDTDAQGETLLRGVLGFFLAGTDQLLTVVGVVAVGGGLLVGVTAYGATRTTVADRRETIQVVRATGAPPGTVLRLFGLRAALLGGIGVALGYAVGVIAANAAVNVAVAAGLPTSLSVAVTAEVAAVLAVLAAAFLVVATVGGLLAARRAATAPPAVERRRLPVAAGARPPGARPDGRHPDRVSPGVVGVRRRCGRRGAGRDDRRRDGLGAGRRPPRRERGSGCLRRRPPGAGDRRQRRDTAVRGAERRAGADAGGRLRGVRGAVRRAGRRGPAAAGARRGRRRVDAGRRRRGRRDGDGRRQHPVGGHPGPGRRPLRS